MLIENSRARGQGTWLMFSAGTSWKSWSGIAFESICIKHIDQIKQAIGIRNVYAEVSVWRYQPKNVEEQGAQIDMLIDRADRCINLCEMKFASDVFDISKFYSRELENKQKVFRVQTKSKKTLFLTMIIT